MENIKDLTDKELHQKIAEKYGEEWKLEHLDENDELVKEWILRLTTGYFEELK